MSIHAALSREEREENRREAGKMFQRGRSQAEVAKKFNVSRAAACKWYATWDKEGLRGLDSKGPPGFDSMLDEKGRKKFKTAILKGPLPAGYETNLWTINRLVEVLKKTTKVKFGPVRTWQIVRSLGFTPQKPALRAKERDEEKIADWKTRRLPSLKKMGTRTWVLARI